MASKDELDALITKAGVGKRTAQKLHEANGTSGDTPAPAEKRSNGGHGPSAPQMPNFGDTL